MSKIEKIGDKKYLATANNGSTFNFVDKIPRTKDEISWAVKNNYVIPAFEAMDMEIDLLLDHVDLKLDWYIPSVEAFDFMNFMRLCLGSEPENLNSKAHYFFVDAMFGSEEIKSYFQVRGIDFDELSRDVIILSSREFSKALHYSTLIATPSGPKEIRYIKDGDMVISRTGKPTRVIKKSNMIMDNTFEMVLEDGRRFKSSNDHRHILWRRKSKYIGYYKDGKKCSKKDGGKAYFINGMEEVVMTSQELASENIVTNRTITDNQRRGYENKYYIPRMDSGIQYDPVNFPIDPYTVGVILGDGSVSEGVKLSQTSMAKKYRKSLTNNNRNRRMYKDDQKYGESRGRTRITCHKDDVDNLINNIPYELAVKGYKSRKNIVDLIMPKDMNSVIAEYIGCDNSYTKKVPKILLNGSVSQRLSLLQGLMDTDGTINKKGSTSYTTVSKQLADDIVYLVRSLGGSARISERKTNSKFGKAYQVLISINTYSIFRLKRKKDRETYIPARDYFPIKSFELVHSEPSYCLTVECPTSSFVMADGLITHNSTITIFFILYMAARGIKPNFGRVNYGMYVSDRMKGNVKVTMQTIETIYMGSEYLQSIFEEVHFTDEECWFIRKPQTQKEIRIYNKAMAQGKKIKEVPKRSERMFKITGLGCSGGRGSRSGLDRPQFAIFDDMIANEKDAYSKAILDSIDSTIEADVGSSLSGNGNFRIYIGTGYHVDDPVCKRVRELAGIPVVFPKAEVAPHGDIYDSNGELVKPALKEEDFVSVWKDRHSFKNQRADYAKAELAYKRGNPKPLKTINQEFYIRLTSEHERLIPDSCIKTKDLSYIKENAMFFNWLLTTDYTTTGNKNSDFSVAILWAMDSEENMYMIDIKAEKMDLTEQYQNTLNMINDAISWGASYVEIGVEIDGQQSLHLIALERFFEKNKASEKLIFAKQIEKSGKKVTWEGIKSKGSGDKFWRLKITADEFYRGKIIISKELAESGSTDFEVLMHQIKNVSQTEIKTKNDDCLDGISQISLIDRDFPTMSFEEARRMQEEIGYNDDYEYSDFGYGTIEY